MVLVIYTYCLWTNNIVLDSKIFFRGYIFKTPPFYLNTKNIEKAFEYMKNKNVEITTKIENDHWFNFKDPDGNHLMICQC